MAVLTTAEAKEHLRVSGSDDDALIAAHILAAEQFIEDMTGIVCTEREGEAFTFDAFEDQFRLPRAPVEAESVVITYLDTANATQTVDAADYRVFEMYGITRVTPVSGSCWPTPACAPGAVTITANIGYPDGETIDAAIKAAAKLIVGALYDGFDGKLEDVPGVMGLLFNKRLSVL